MLFPQRIFSLPLSTSCWSARRSIISIDWPVFNSSEVSITSECKLEDGVLDGKELKEINSGVVISKQNQMHHQSLMHLKHSKLRIISNLSIPTIQTSITIFLLNKKEPSSSLTLKLKDQILLSEILLSLELSASSLMLRVMEISIFLIAVFKITLGALTIPLKILTLQVHNWDHWS